MKKKVYSIFVLSIVQAIGAGLVLWLWSLFITHADKWINVSNNQPTVASMVVLPAVFIITAVASGGAVLGYPLSLVLKGRWYSAITLVALTLLWLALLAVALIAIY
ncbi:hypothetical protein JXA59_02645 [Patescibacteria group bacterium]|nr:hypothetical protein [Patescibacteria group bacterium]